MFLLSFLELSGLHCSLQLSLAGSFLCVFTMICNFQSYSPISRISREAERSDMETSLFQLWSGFASCLRNWAEKTSLSWLPRLWRCPGNTWTMLTPHTKQFCCAPSLQRGLHDEVAKQTVRKQEEIPCPRMWLQRRPPQWKFKQIRNGNK